MAFKLQIHSLSAFNCLSFSGYMGEDNYVCYYLATMRWNGTDITGVPTFIYHDELIAGAPNTSLAPDPDGPGVLSCSSETIQTTTTINWHLTVDHMIDPENITGNFLLRLGSMRSQVLQNEDSLFPTGGRSEYFFNGLWSCTQDGTRVHVGLYSRPSSE